MLVMLVNLVEHGIRTYDRIQSVENRIIKLDHEVNLVLRQLETQIVSKSVYCCLVFMSCHVDSLTNHSTIVTEQSFGWCQSWKHSSQIMTNENLCLDRNT